MAYSKPILLSLLLALSLPVYSFYVNDGPTNSTPRVVWKANFWDAVIQDYKEHYSPTGLIYLGGLLSVGGIFANTSIDMEISHYWQNHIRSNKTNQLSEAVDTFTQLRQIRVVIPSYLTAMALNDTLQSPWTEPVGRWGEHSIRVLLLGAPQQAILTEALGSHRPYGESGWSWFDSNRGVSGHAFYGAVPLISAAAVSESWQAKCFFYSLSTLPALSRINTNKHYFSQALMGWSIAFLSSQSVLRANCKLTQQKKISMAFLPIDGGVMLGARLDF